MPDILEEEEQENLGDNFVQRREGDVVRLHADALCERVEEPDLRELDGEVGEENHLGACPLLFEGRDLGWLELPFAEVGCSVDEDPGYAASEVDDLRRGVSIGAWAGMKGGRMQKKRRTSCMRKDMIPVASTGLSIHIYQAIHCCSAQFSADTSVPAYALANDDGSPCTFK